MTKKRVVIVIAQGLARLWIHDKFKRSPDMAWNRELSHSECDVLFENPWCMFRVPKQV